MKLLAFLLFLCPMIIWAQNITLVDAGVSRCVIVQANDSDICKLGARLLQRTISKATGAEINIINYEKVNRNSEQVKIFIGLNTKLHNKYFSNLQLSKEEYVITCKNGNLYIFGSDSGNLSPADWEDIGRNSYLQIHPGTLFAVSAFLDRFLKVRWIWPGPSGEYVPQTKTLVIPSNLFLKNRPPLELRMIRAANGAMKKQLNDSELAAGMKKHIKAFNLWSMLHLQGQRRKIVRAGHNYQDWYQTYHKTHPEYLAKPPAGIKKPSKPEYAKLCLSNPVVMELILQKWRNAGKPKVFPVGPNDGRNFCTCNDCRAMDKADYALMDIWMGNVDLSRRYAVFWNQLLKSMRRETPDATIALFSYSCYKSPPEDVKLEPGMVVSMVLAYLPEGQIQWQRWSRDGSLLLLRPNWWHMFFLAPFGEYHTQGNFFKMAQANGMIGYDMDSVQGTWGVQAPLYYLICRLSYRPDLSVDEIKKEFSSAFGEAQEEILEYLTYWEKYSDSLQVSIPAGGVVLRRGPYEHAASQYGFSLSVLRSSWEAMPFLYPETIIKPAEDLLLKAAEKVRANAEYSARVKFMHDGLRHLRALRDAYAATRNIGGQYTKKEIRKRYENLMRLRQQCDHDGVIWAGKLNWYERYRGIELNKPAKPVKIDMNGL